MKFLADEGFDFGVVRALRPAGHEVASIAEDSPGSADETVIERAFLERRILLTEDKDFGQLVFARAKAASGVVFVRWPGSARSTLPGVVLDVIAKVGGKLEASFVTIEPGRARISRLPGS